MALTKWVSIDYLIAMGIEALSQISISISEIEQMLKAYSNNLSNLTGKNGVDHEPKLRIEKLILIEISEITAILAFIDASSKRYQSLFMERVTRGVIPSVLGHTLFPSKEEIAEREQNLTELTVFIKALYEWLYHLKELIQPGKAVPAIQLSDDLNLILGNYCTFRHYFITHKGEREFDLSSAFIEFSGFDNPKLFMLRLPPEDSAISGLTALIEDCKAEVVSAGLSDGDNYFRKCEILAKIHCRYKHKSGKWNQIDEFFKNNGMISDSPLQIAEFTKRLLKEVIPPSHSQSSI